jgi:CRISPR-associated protein Cas8a1/Csx13
MTMPKGVGQQVDGVCLDGMRLDLFAPGMTLLHKAGLAGLWMTLNRFEERRLQLEAGSWKLADRSIELHWTDRAAFFESLFTNSFKLTAGGLIWLTALGDPADNLQQAVLVHNALLGSFLQHGQTRKADPSSRRTGAASFDLGDETHAVHFQRVSSYVHQKAYADLAKPTNGLAVPGWLFPGAVTRHVAHGDATAFEETPERRLALLYSPAGVVYFQVTRRSRGRRPRFALVVPEISDLRRYAEARRVLLPLGAKELQVAGSAEAGWKVLSILAARGLIRDFASAQCRVFSFGALPWSKQQKTRVDVYTVHAGSAEKLKLFGLCQQLFQVRRVKPKNADPFWDVPQVPDLIARNLTSGRLWHAGFADFVADAECRKHVFNWERKGLNGMINEALSGMLGTREEKFVLACHSAWRARMRQLYERAERENADTNSLIQREFERLRAGLSRCKNAAALREAVTGFWARAGGSLPELRDAWREIIPMFDDWHLAKDLALLALASYAPRDAKEEPAASSPHETTEGQEERNS